MLGPSRSASAFADVHTYALFRTESRSTRRLRQYLVGITFHTPSAHHAYGLAAQFRGRGVPVVLGGPHVTLMPDEAQDHADVIFVGEAEILWE